MAHNGEPRVKTLGIAQSLLSVVNSHSRVRVCLTPQAKGLGLDGVFSTSTITSVQ